LITESVSITCRSRKFRFLKQFVEYSRTAFAWDFGLQAEKPSKLDLIVSISERLRVVAVSFFAQRS